MMNSFGIKMRLQDCRISDCLDHGGRAAAAAAAGQIGHISTEQWMTKYDQT